MSKNENESKPLIWLKGEVKTPPFSSKARLEAGFLLRKLQGGETLSMPISRPMPVIGSNCHELRINDEDKTWRIVYFIDGEAIVILDVFDKTTNKTPKKSHRNLSKKIKTVSKYLGVKPMNQTKIERLKANGWQIGNTSDFLGLSREEMAFIDLKIALSTRLKELRLSQNISQESLAKKIKSSQSRIAKMEACDSSVSVDLILKTIFSLGGTNQDILDAIQSLGN